MCLWLSSIHCERERKRERESLCVRERECVRERKVRFGGSGLASVCGGTERKSFSVSELKIKIKMHAVIRAQETWSKLNG